MGRKILFGIIIVLLILVLLNIFEKVANFVGIQFDLDFFSLFIISACAMSIVISYALWEKYGKDEQVVNTVEFNLPKGYNSAEIGYLAKGSADINQVISLLLYLASKGYLKIEKTDESSAPLLNITGFRIVKLKEYDGDNECEKAFFDGLFLESRKQNSTSIGPNLISAEGKVIRNFVNDGDLYNKFYITVGRIRSLLSSHKIKDEISDTTARSKMIYIVIMLVSIIILTILKVRIEIEKIGIFFALPTVTRNKFNSYNRRYYKHKKKCYVYCWCYIWNISSTSSSLHNITFTYKYNSFINLPCRNNNYHSINRIS